MKTHRFLPILITALVFAASGRSFALIDIHAVSKAEAKDMGMKLQATAQGPDQVRVTLELKKDGKLKKFQRVELWIQDGEKVLFVGTLSDNELSAPPGSVVTAFSIDRSLLSKAHLDVMVEDGEEKIGGVLRVNRLGYELKLSEHVPPDLLPKAAATKPVDEEDHGYETPAGIKAMPLRKATVLEHHGCYSMFSTVEGKKFSIGSPAAGSQVVEFLNTLKVGTTCELPRAFLEFEKASPAYDNVEKIKAIPPCKAAVEHIGVYDARLRTAAGKLFFIGSETGEQEVWHFVSIALKVGQTYELPRAFLDFEERRFYSTAEAIAKMPVAKAVLECSAPCYSVFKTTEGKHIVIGDPSSKAEVIDFLRSLEEGKTYQFPDVFLEYRKAVPVYDTAEMIKAMPPCKAVLEAALDCGSRFKTSDGRKFLIGSPSETREVTDFMRTLKEGQNYDFPGAFLDYQKRKQ